MKKSILALSLLVGLSAAASSYAALPETVRIGTDTTYAPFSSKDAKGDFVGFDIDLGNEMCKRMQVKCTWVASDFDALILTESEKIDAIISSLSITDKRQQEIAFSDKLYAADSRLIAAKGSPIQPTLDSLKVNMLVCCRDQPRKLTLTRPGVVKAWMWWPMPTRIWSIPIWLQDVWMLRYKMKLLPAKDSSSNLLVKISPLLAHQ